MLHKLYQPLRKLSTVLWCMSSNSWGVISHLAPRFCKTFMLLQCMDRCIIFGLHCRKDIFTNIGIVTHDREHDFLGKIISITRNVIGSWRPSVREGKEINHFYRTFIKIFLVRWIYEFSINCWIYYNYQDFIISLDSL